MHKTLLYIYIILGIFACHNSIKKTSLITGVYVNQQDSSTTQYTFLSDTSHVLHFLDVDSSLITADCYYYIKHDSIFVSSIEHTLQSHIMHLTVYDTLLIDDKKNFTELSTKYYYTKRPHAILDEYK